MKHWQAALAILTTLSASIALADDFKTINGKEYKDVEVVRVEPDGIMLKSKSGISKVYFTELPKEVQERFHYDADKATSYSAAQNAGTQITNLQTTLQLLQSSKEDLQRNIRDEELLSKGSKRAAYIRDLKERLFNVTQEIGRLTNQLHKLENGY